MFVSMENKTLIKCTHTHIEKGSKNETGIIALSESVPIHLNSKAEIPRIYGWLSWREVSAATETSAVPH